MSEDAFRALVEESIAAIPEHLAHAIHNVAFLVAECPSQAQLRDNHISPGETLLGLYEGIPLPLRGESYGIGMTLPDRITIFQRPIEDEAGGDDLQLRRLIEETVWHEVAHYFGYDEQEIAVREHAGTNQVHHRELFGETDKKA
jgi:predicted Zn-dependent protease with MMP-like domain